MTGGPWRSVDVEPLLEYGDRRGWSHVELAHRAGIIHRRLLRWMKNGRLPVWAADDVATALGIHVTQLWPTWHHELDELLEDAS